MIEDNKIYYVEKIINKKIENNKTIYLVKWKDYSSKYNTWEPEENLQEAKELIHEFNTKNKNPSGSFLKMKRNSSKHKIKNKPKSLSFKLDPSIISVLALKQEDNKLIALCEKKDKKGNKINVEMTTEELKKCNPLSLINFYESKIIFIEKKD